MRHCRLHLSQKWQRVPRPGALPHRGRLSISCPGGHSSRSKLPPTHHRQQWRGCHRRHQDRAVGQHLERQRHRQDQAAGKHRAGQRRHQDRAAGRHRAGQRRRYGRAAGRHRLGQRRRQDRTAGRQQEQLPRRHVRCRRMGGREEGEVQARGDGTARRQRGESRLLVSRAGL